MAVYDLEEQEQLAELKAWWKQYGNLVTTVLTIAALGLVAWQGWNRWQDSQAAQASVVYGGVERAAAGHDAKQVRQLTGELVDKFPRTLYAGMAALVSARIQLDIGDVKNAKAQLQWAVENARDDVIKDLARLRLAAVLVDEKAYDEALKLVATPVTASFTGRFADLRGDVLAAQGKAVEARDAYQAAISASEKDKASDVGGQHAAFRELVRIKLEAQGGSVKAEAK